MIHRNLIPCIKIRIFSGNYSLILYFRIITEQKRQKRYALRTFPDLFRVQYVSGRG